MDVLEAIYRRRSVRDYADEAVDDATVELLVQAAVQAPSGMDLQPWSFIAVTDRRVLERWSQAAKTQLMAATPHLAERFGPLVEPGFNIFYNAPALMVICAATPDPMSLTDCCLAAQNFMLAACARGLGSCWIGFAQAWMDTPEGRAELSLPAGHVAAAPIIFGRPRAAPDAPPRRAAPLRWIRGAGRPG
jgi:nitroreductase